MNGINNLDELMNGAVTERYEHAMQEVVENIYDLNTEASKARKITIIITIKPNAKRKIADFSVETKTTLAPRMALTTSLMLGIDEDGSIVATEFESGVTPGQMDMDGNEYGVLKPIANIK